MRPLDAIEEEPDGFEAEEAEEWAVPEPYDDDEHDDADADEELCEAAGYRWAETAERLVGLIFEARHHLEATGDAVRQVRRNVAPPAREDHAETRTIEMVETEPGVWTPCL